MRKAAVVAACVCVLAGCRQKPSGTVFIEPALATLVPADATFLAGIRVDKLRETPLGKRILAQRLPSAVERFRRDTGLDPSKDLWQFLIAGDGKQMVVLCRGKFSPMGLEPTLEREGAKRMGYRGYTMLGDERAAVLFLNSTTAAAGSPAALRRVVDERDSNSGIPRRFDPLLKSIPAASQIWAAGDVSSLIAGLNFGEHGNAANFAQFARSLDDIAGGADFREGLKANGWATTKTVEDASRLNGAFRAAVGLARLNTPDNQPAVLRAFDAFKSEVKDGKRVEFRVDMATAELDALLGFVESRRGVVRP